jgi:RHS repeat-associated protein
MAKWSYWVSAALKFLNRFPVVTQSRSITLDRRLVVAIQLITILLASGLYPTQTYAQTSPEVMDVRPYAPLHGTDLETVSLMNGTLSVHIPVWSIPQRGKVKLNFNLAYHDVSYSETETCESLNHGEPTQCTTHNYTCPPPALAACGVSWGLGGSAGALADQFGIHIAASTDVQLFVQYGVAGGGSSLTGLWFQIRTPDGGSHKLTTTSTGDWRAADGTGWEYQTSNCTLRDNEGTEYVYACTQSPTSEAQYTPTIPGDLLYVEDTNGNRITLNYNSSNNAFLGWTDSLGRSIPPFYSAPSTSTSSCPSGSTNALLWQIPGVSPGIVICQTAVQLQTDFFAGNPNTYGQYSEATSQLTALSGLILPSGDVWSFSYAPMQGDPDYGSQVNGVQINYGDIRQINFPTGGSVHYIWARQGGICGMGSAQMNNSFLASRTIQYPQGPSEPWTYSFSPSLPSAASQAYQVTVTDPYGNVSVHSMTDLGGCSYYETSNTIYDNANNPYETITTDYQAQAEAPFIEGSSITGFGALPIATHAIWPDGTSKTTAWTYDSGFQSNQTPTGDYAGLSYGNKTSETAYNFGSASTPGPALRSTTMDYWAFDSGSALSANILAPLSSIVTTDSITGATQQTTYGYDESGLGSGNASQTVGSPAVTIWDPSPPNGSVRGNQTSVSKYLNTANSFLVTQFAYNNTGTIASIKLPENNPLPDTITTYSYSAAYQGAYLSSITNSLSQSTSYSYDLATGELLTATDENQQSTTYAYYPDTRLESVIGPSLPVGNPETDYSYPSPSEVDSKTKENSSAWVQKKSLFDGLGRISHQETLNACPNGDYVAIDTTYDLDERVFSVSNPHCGQSSSPTDGITYNGTPQGTVGYDPLDRPTLVTDADGVSTQSWSYQDDTTTYRDEAGSSWSRAKDALGRLATVIEPGNLQTTYAYNAFGDLTGSAQNGNSSVGDVPVNRSFSYDSLSRLTTSSNPETGAVSYQYDAHSNILSRTDARGTITSYSYDALNRLNWKRFSDGTPTLGFGYDGLGENGTPVGQPSLNSIGRLSHISNEIDAAATYSYDALGRVTLETECIPSDCSYDVSVSANYDAIGNVTDLTYPDGRHIQQAFDNAGRLNTSALVDINGASASQSYLQSITYAPDDSPQVVTLGNGVQQTIGKNSRLQVQALSVSAPASGLNGEAVLSRAYCYVNCTTGGTADNGNIWGITDTLSSANTKGFTYDSLNRIKQFWLGGALNQQYSVDSFGNLSSMSGPSPVSTFGPGNNRINNLPCASALPAYDASGNQTCWTDQYGGVVQNGYDAEDHITSMSTLGTSSPFVSYVYDGNGGRVRKSNADGTYTEYVSFSGQPVAEKDQNGNWTDYVVANGQKIAKVADAVPMAHLYGSSDVGGVECGSGPSPNLSYVVKTGDIMSWSEYKQNAVGGIIQWFAQAGGGYFGDQWHSVDTQGYGVNNDPRINQWVNRSFDMSEYAGQTLAFVGINKDVTTPPGAWSIWETDVAITSRDGTVTQIPLSTMIGSGTAGCQGQSDYIGQEIQQASTAPGIVGSGTDTHLYTDDHLGTTQMELSGGGWPVWSGQFDPFGQELDPGSTTMRYKFTGKERDQESGLDYFGARYYGSSMGRWMSPDWSSIPVGVPYASLSDPQSLNLYAYVGNNPLSHRDGDGHHQECAPDTFDSKTNTVTAGACHEVPDWWQFQGARRFLGRHKTAVKVTANVVIGVTAISGVFDAGASEAAVPGEIALEEALLEGGEIAAEEGAETGAVESAANVANKAEHIFGEKNLAKHGLEDVLKSFGGNKEQAFQAIQKATSEATQGTSGTFEKVVQVAGENVTVRGSVVNGAARIGTAFIPK